VNPLPDATDELDRLWVEWRDEVPELGGGGGG
jgi:hypothetical protein